MNKVISMKNYEHLRKPSKPENIRCSIAYNQSPFFDTMSSCSYLGILEDYFFEDHENIQQEQEFFDNLEHNTYAALEDMCGCKLSLKEKEFTLDVLESIYLNNYKIVTE